MAVCTLCEHNPLTSPDETARNVCDGCAPRLGIIAMPPSQRPPGPCQRCGQSSFIRSIPRELTVKATHDTTWDKTNPPRHAPMFVTYEVITRERAWRAGKAVDDLDPYQGRGMLEMYVCRHCGFVEWYCLHPGFVPIGPEYMTEIVEYDRRGAPYR